MPSTKIMITSLVSALALLDGALAGKFVMRNKAPYPVYYKAVRGADGNGPPDDSPIETCYPGQEYCTIREWYKYGVWPNDASQSYHVSKNPDCSDHYEVHANMDPGPITWYQLSAESGDPFDGEKFAVAIPGADCDDDWEKCLPYGDCEAPTHKCNSDNDIYFFLGCYDFDD